MNYDSSFASLAGCEPSRRAACTESDNNAGQLAATMAESPGSTGRSTARRRGRPHRREASEQKRRAIFDAAVKVVGRHGYAEASITRITTQANVAQGTFYLYYKSRQDLLDQLLPSLGEEMLAFIRERVGGVDDLIEREEQRLRAFFAYIDRRPELYRILHEAETFAPKGHRRHYKTIADDYTRALARDFRKAGLPVRGEEELEATAYILMAARDYLSMRYAHWAGRGERLPEAVVETYIQIVRGGLFGTAED